MINRPSLLPKELRELYELAVIADKTSYCDLRKATMALLTMSLFPKPEISAVETEPLSTDVERLKSEGRLKPFPEELKAKHEARLKATVWADEAGPVSREVMQSQVPVPTVDDVRPADDGRGFPAEPGPQSEKTVTEMLAEEGARLGVIDAPNASELTAAPDPEVDYRNHWHANNSPQIRPHEIGESTPPSINAAKPKRKSPDWSAEETERLIAYVDANPSPRHWDTIVSEFPGRTARALQNRADRLGLGKGDGAKSITKPVADALAAKQPHSDPVTQDHVEDLRKALEEAFAEPVQVQKAAAVEPESVPDATLFPSADILAQQVTQAKENLDEMFPPNRASAVRESPPSRVEPNSSKAKPAATFPPAWEPKETFKAPETIDDVMAWCRRQGDDVAQDGKMFTVNGRKLFPSEFIARANNLRRAAGVKPFDVVSDEAAE